jgi:rhodanese-related sulfurtransferase
MREVLERFPGARRALFRQYHIGGCSSCGFRLEETLGALCERQGGLSVAEVLRHLETSQDQDAKLLIAPAELADWRRQASPPRIVDLRSSEEWDAARIEGATRFTQELMQEILGRWPKDGPFVLCDHEGHQALDAAAFFAGHGFTQVRCLRGGIDAWSREVDSTVPRYTHA